MVDLSNKIEADLESKTPNILEENVKIIFCLIFNPLIICVLIRGIFLKEYLRTYLIIVKSLERFVRFLFFYLLLAKYLYDFKLNRNT